MEVATSPLTEVENGPSPVFSSEVHGVINKRCVRMVLYANGRQTGRMAARVLRGESAEDIPLRGAIKQITAARQPDALAAPPWSQTSPQTIEAAPSAADGKWRRWKRGGGGGGGGPRGTFPLGAGGGMSSSAAAVTRTVAAHSLGGLRGGTRRPCGPFHVRAPVPRGDGGSFHRAGRCSHGSRHPGMATLPSAFWTDRTTEVVAGAPRWPRSGRCRPRPRGRR